MAKKPMNGSKKGGKGSKSGKPHPMHTGKKDCPCPNCK